MIIWLDLETTGLVPADDRILEIAVGIADEATPTRISKLYSKVLHCPEYRVEHLDPFILNMHTENGLLAECLRQPSYVNEWYASREICALLPEGQHTLAGNSVHFDAEFLREYMPSLHMRFSHRHLDVSGIRLFLRGLGYPEVPKVRAHRAWEDVLLSGQELEEFRTQVGAP